MVSIFIVDHHPTERLGLRRLLERASDVSVVGEVGSTDEALEQMPSMDVDIVLADLQMDEMNNGMDFTRKVKAEMPGVAVLIVTSYVESDHNVERAEQAGANGFLSKELVEEKLVETVRRVAAGAAFFAER